jgi:predicted dehydrogenase
VAVIGAGVGRAHIREYLASPEANLVAICDADAARLKAVTADLPGVATYTDHKALLKHPGLQAVSVALPNFLHAPISMDALSAGMHVLCEKPLALNAGQAEQMVALSHRVNRILMVNFNYRFTEAAWVVHQAVDAGLLGDIYFARTGWHRNRGIPGMGGWFTAKERSGGGALIDLGVHRLDLALWYMGYPQPVSVSGAAYSYFGNTLASEQGTTFTVDDLAAGFVKFANGASLVIEASWAGNSEKREGMFTTLYGLKGGAEFRNVNEGYEYESRLYLDVAGTLTEARPLSKPPHTETIRGHFVRCCLTGTQPICPGEHGLIIMRILDALYESAASGHEVRLD